MKVHYTDNCMNSIRYNAENASSSITIHPNFMSHTAEESAGQPIPTTNVSQPFVNTDAFLRPRTLFQVAAFNVRTLRKIGQQAALARTLEGLNVDICCLSETRLYDSSSTIHLRTPSPSTTMFSLRCSGDPTASSSGTAGVGIALSPRAEAALLEWIPVNSRLCAVRVSGSCKVNHQRDTKRCLFIISAYAPTDCSSDEAKDEFYASLTELLRKAPRSDIVVLAGDLNARVGRLTHEEDQFGGPHGLDLHRNDNGERLLTTCADHGLFLASLNFRHRKRHLATWRPAARNQRMTQIDHVAISYRWRGSVQDCRSYWSTCVDSDHAIVCAKISMRFCGKRPNKCKRFDVTKLRDPPTMDNFRRDLAVELESKSPSMLENHWAHIQQSMHQVANRVCGMSRQLHKPWISTESVHLLDVRRNIPADYAHNAERQELKRQLIKSLRTDKEKWWNSKAKEMEVAWSIGDSRQLFQLIRSTGSRRLCVSETICEIDGSCITNIQRRSNRWAEHFKAQFNCRPTPTSTTQATRVASWAVSVEPPREEEVQETIIRLKNNKAPGEDELPAELYKAGGASLLQQLTELFTRIWTLERVPTSWSTSIIVPIFKRGARTDCTNHRGISLISVASKILVSIILRRLSTTRELLSREEQAGFRSGRGCVDQIFVLRQLLEHRHTYKRPTIVVFLDIRAAFDSVDRTVLWNYLIQSGIPEKLVTIMNALYNETMGRVRVYNQLSEPFPISSGVRQGCPISPFLFNFVIDDILTTALSRTNDAGVELLPGSKIRELDYADDIVLMGDNVQSMQNILDCLTLEVNRYGLLFSPKKCKILSQDWSGPPITLSLAGESIATVERFMYLGSQITTDGEITAEITSRILKARLAFKNLQHLWRRRDISLSIKGRVYNASVRPTLLYGCEAWPLRTEDVRRLTVFDHRCLRSISRVWWQQRVSNADVRRRVFHEHNSGPLKNIINLHRLRWLGHVLRMNPQRLPRRAVFAVPDVGWKKSRGGQRTTWRKNMKALTTRLSCVGRCRLPGWGPKDNDCLWLETLAVMAQDRTQWRTCSVSLLN